MTPEQKIKYWKRRFRVLRRWKVVSGDPKSRLNKITIHCKHEKKHVIYPWGHGEQEDDYILHEILHCCQFVIRKSRDFQKAEELFVQDLCKIMNGKG